MRWLILLSIMKLSFLSGMAQQNTVTLESSIFGRDALVNTNSSGSVNYGSHGHFLVWWGTNGGSPVYYREYFDYNLGLIPSGATIQSAILYLYNSGTEHDLRSSSLSYIEKVTAPWDEYTINWNNQPAWSSTNRVTVPSATSSYQNLVIDMTALIIDRYNNPNTTYGFVMRLAYEGAYAGFHLASRENPNPALRHKLVITYSTPYCALSNISSGKTATQSSNLNAIDLASKVVDTDTLSFNQTAAELTPWWQVDLGSTQKIVKLEIKNRMNCTVCITEQRLKNFTVFLSNNPITATDINSLKSDPTVSQYVNNIQVTDGGKVTFDNIYKTARYVRIWAEYPVATILNMADVKIFTNSNILPSVTMTSLTEQNPIYPGQSFTANAAASDNENSIIKVEFFNGSTKLGEDVSAPYSITVDNVQLGTYTVTAKVTDGCGATAISTNSLNAVVLPLESCVSNVSSGKMARQSSTHSLANLAEFAIDNNQSTLAITSSTATPYIDVDLLEDYTIRFIEILNRTDCCPERLSNFDIFLSSNYFTSNDLTSLQNDTSIFKYHYPGTAGTKVTTPTLNIKGRYIRIRLRGTNFLQIKEINVYGCGPVIPDQSCYWEKRDTNIYYLSGPVGVGLNAPTHALTVNGTIKANDYLTTLQSWPDYVFASEYFRLSVPELKHYIQKHKHLPNLPSQSDVMTDGFEVGTMQQRMLEKIEELFLYLIESRKRIIGKETNQKP